MEEPFLNLDFLQDSLADLNSIPIASPVPFPHSRLSTSKSIFQHPSTPSTQSDSTSNTLYDFFAPSSSSTTQYEFFSNDHIPVTTPSPPMSTAPRIHACSSCHRSKKTCDRNRPCQRCVNRRQAHLCTDRLPGKKRKPPPSPAHSSASSASQTTTSYHTTTSSHTSVLPPSSPFEIPAFF
jgi:hypothetical protein